MIKNWIVEKAQRITKGYQNPFTGEMTDERNFAHFRVFAVPVELANQFDSFEELLAHISK